MEGGMETGFETRSWSGVAVLAWLTTVAGGCGTDQTSPPEPPPPDLDVAFELIRDGNPTGDIYRVHANGEGLVNLTNSVGVNTAPDWSPEGQFIAFTSSRDGFDPTTGNAGVYRMRPDGSDVTRIVMGDGGAWSRDGRLAIAQEGTGAFDYLLVVVDGDGANPVTVTTGGSPLREPSWSPDGSRIAYHRAAGIQGPMEGRLEVANADGTEGIMDLGPGSSPAWSPDGTKILSGMTLMNPDGTGRRQIRASGYAGTWSPDGAYIAFVDSDSTGQVDLYLMTADGRQEWRVTNSPEWELNPTIGPRQ